MLRRSVCRGVLQMAQQQEAQTLVAASFGDTMLHAIGTIYQSQADVHLGNFFEGTFAKMKSSSTMVRSSMQAASAALKVRCVVYKQCSNQQYCCVLHE